MARDQKLSLASFRKSVSLLDWIGGVKKSRRQQKSDSEALLLALCSKSVFPFEQPLRHLVAGMPPSKRKSTDGPGSGQKPKIQRALQQSIGKGPVVPVDGVVAQVTAWLLDTGCWICLRAQVGGVRYSFGRDRAVHALRVQD